MKRFDVNILGVGSALPTTRHYPSGQIVNFREKLFMVDCGEGSQLQMRKMKLHFGHLNHIFISHLHGDHCFGLPGLLSTMGMLGRTADIVIHAPSDAEKVFAPFLQFFCKDMPYRVRFNAIDTKKSDLIYEDKGITVRTIPLKHRIPTCGFLFEERAGKPHLVGDLIKFYNIPISQLAAIKDGADFVTPAGVVVPNSRLTTPASKHHSYAYCSDTCYRPSIVPIIEGVDLLYHEATFADDQARRAKETFHTTARQAATIAKEAGVGKLLIGHFSARYTDEKILLKEAKEIFENTEVAKELHNYILQK